MKKRSVAWLATVRRVRRHALLAGLLMATVLPGRAISTTTITDTIYLANGGIAQGTLLVSWPSFTASDGSAVAGGSVTVTIAPNGGVTLQLTPNEGSQPAGTYYTAVYHLSDGTVEKEYWVVPQLPTATIGMMRSKVVPAAVAQPFVSAQNVNAAVESAVANFLPLKGGSLSGALNLAGDPQGATQAATKAYVDAHGVDALPTGIVFGSVGSAPRVTTGADVVSLWGGGACTGFLKNDLSCGNPAVTLPNTLVRGQGAGQPAIPAVYGDVVSLFGGGSCNGFIKSDGTCSNPSLTLPNALVRGNGASAATGASYSDVAATFHSTGTPLTNYIINTSFNEGAAGTTLGGTTPAVDATGDTWHLFAGAVWNYAAGGGAVAPSPTPTSTEGVTINAGQSNVSVLVDYSSVPAGGAVQVLMRYSDPQDLVAATISSTQVTIYDLVGGNFAMSGPFAVNSAALSFALAGNSISIFSNGVLAGRASLNPANSAATRFGFAFQGPGTNATLASFAVTGAPTPVSIPCAGYLNGDGTCASTASDVMATDSNGHIANLAEKQTQTVNGVTTIACDEDQGMGRFDARCAKYAGGVFGATPGLALQSLANTLICYESQVGKAPTVTFPSGVFSVGTPTQPALVFPTGGNYIGAAGRNGVIGTVFHATYNNHNAVQFNSGQTATCADGAVHTANLTGGNYANLGEIGCGTGACTNVPGDTGNWPNGGPHQGGIFLGDSQGTFKNISATNNGDSGVITSGQDSVFDGLWGFNNMEWYWFGKNSPNVSAPGAVTATAATTGGTLAAHTYFYSVTALNSIGETTGSTEASVATTGSTGAVSLSWAAVANAASYKVYRGTSSGAESVFYSAATNSFTDTGAAGTAGTVPTLNTTTYNPATDNQHCDVILGSLDGQFDHVETYGFQNSGVGPEYGHLAGICWGGGNSTLDHAFVQLGQIGIITTGAGNARLSNFRIEGPRGEGILIGAGNGGGAELVTNGEIHTACAATNAIFAVANSPVQASLGAHCNYIDDEGSGTLYSNIQLGYDPFFGASVATGGMWAPFGEQDINVTAGGISGGLHQFPATFLPGAGVTEYKLFGGATGANVTGPAPSVANSSNGFTPVDSAPIAYTGVTGGWAGQEFNVFVPNGNANVTLQGTTNGGHWHTCGNTGADFNLAQPGTYRYVIYPGPSGLDYYPFCSSAPAASGGGAASCGSNGIPCTNAANSFSADQTITTADNTPLTLVSSGSGTTVSLANTSAGGKQYRFSSTGAGNGTGAGFFAVTDITDGGVPEVAVGPAGVTPATPNLVGTFYRAGEVATGATFTVSGCAATGAAGGATAGALTSGTAGGCSFIVTMGSSTAAPHGWACFANDLTTPTDVLHQTGTTATTASFTGTTANADQINFACTGY